MQKLVPSLLGLALIAGCSVYDLSLFRNEFPEPGGTGGSSNQGDADAMTGGDGAGTTGAGGGSGQGGAGGGSAGNDASSSGGGSAGASEGGPVVTDGSVNDGPVTDSGPLVDANGERDANVLRDASTTRDADAAVADGAVDASADVQDAAPPPRDVIIIVDGPECGGTALSLDNSRFFTVNRPIQDDFTLEAWIKTASPSPLPPATDYWAGRGVVYADVGGSGNDFAATILNDRFAFGVGNPGGTDTNLISASTVTNDQWIHVSATRQRSTGATQLFVNAVLEASAGAGNLNALTQPTTMAIGGNTNGAGNFIGLMDEVRLWNVVRTQAEIAATMHQRLLGNEAGLVGYWRFDNAGTPVDSSPTNATATMTGNPLYVPSDALCATP